ncbi:ankyrin repeat-containing domain protein [Mycena polygramma]|nr:ankyrin repeat-containing domain protein [Mycena polygramma]
MDIAGTITTFGGLVMKIKASIDKVGENKKNLGDLQRQVEDTVQELERLAKGHPGKVPATGELKEALGSLMGQLNAINNNCQALTHSKGIPAFVKAWFKRDEIEAEIKKLKENRTNCCTQFQLLSAARTEENTAQTQLLATRIDETAAKTEAKADQLITLAHKEELQRWFQALDMREKQRATYALRHNDSGRWVLEGTKFTKWKEEPGCLWIRGNSGTGKSVLSSIAIDHLFHYRLEKIANRQPATPTFGIAYFYFDFRDEQKQLVENMLRSIIMQLSEQSSTPYSVLVQHFKSCQGGKFPTYGDLLAMLDAILSQFTGTYIVLDALDECSEHDKLVEFVSTLRGWGKPVHLLVASQPRTLFLESLAFKEASVVILEPDTTHADILQFVNSELKLNSKLKHLKKAKDAAPKIVDKSNGMFRMAACLLQELARRRIDTNINKILAKLPNNLFGIYTRFLQSIDEDDFVYIAALLRWVTFSVEPVTLCQLDEALAINFSEPDHWVFEPENRGRVEDVCGLLEGLVTVVPATPTSSQHQALVALAHSSVNDYIVSQKFLDVYKHDLKEPPSHTFLAQSCVTYLLHFEYNPLNADTLPHYPLAQYAAKFWSHHLLQCHDRGVLQHSTMHLLEQGSKQFAALNCVCDIDNSWHGPDWSRHAPSPLYLCSMISYVEVVRILLEHGADVNTVGGAYGTALQGASTHGFVEVVRILLEHGADVNAVGGAYGTALQGASAHGFVEVVRILLEHSADVNAVGRVYGTALQGASAYGFVEVVRILLEHGADVNAAEGGYHGSALQGAASNGHIDIVRLLLEKGTDVNTAGGRYGSALQAAASKVHMDTRNIQVFRMLLDHGADVNAAGGEYGSALLASAVHGNVENVRILLKKGAGVNAVGGKYGSALHWVAASGNVDVVRLLLEKGADVNAASANFGSALQGAAWQGHVDIVRVLLEKGADVNATGGIYGSALQAAAWNSHVDIVRILLEHDADVNVAGGKFGSALAAASAEGHGEIAKLLREHGAQDREPGDDSK